MRGIFARIAARLRDHERSHNFTCDVCGREVFSGERLCEACTKALPLIGTHCRDKDAVVASVMIAEMTAYYKSIGRTLIDQLNGIYAMYGKYEHKNISKKYEGAEGNKKMRGLMESLRTQPITSIGGGKVVRTVDFLDQTEYDVPRSDVMLYETDNGLTVIVRPSGTEPLIKFYITAAKSEEENAALFAAAISDIDRRFA